MLTQKDIDFLKDELKDEFATKDDLVNIKDEIITTLDDLAGKFQKFGDELTLIGRRVSVHTDQIEKLEKIHPKGRHSQASV